MSMIGRAERSSEPLGSRAVRLRNHLLQREARRRGLREPVVEDLVALSPTLTLSAAIAWWEREQAGDEDRVYEDAVVTERSLARQLVRMAVIAVLVVMALALFPGDLNALSL